jgi:hypothetical protein
MFCGRLEVHKRRDRVEVATEVRENSLVGARATLACQENFGASQPHFSFLTCTQLHRE